jgi:hypothetical protein
MRKPTQFTLPQTPFKTKRVFEDFGTFVGAYCDDLLTRLCIYERRLLAKRVLRVQRA